MTTVKKNLSSWRNRSLRARMFSLQCYTTLTEIKKEKSIQACAVVNSCELKLNPRIRSLKREEISLCRSLRSIIVGLRRLISFPAKVTVANSPSTACDPNPTTKKGNEWLNKKMSPSVNAKWSMFVKNRRSLEPMKFSMGNNSGAIFCPNTTVEQHKRCSSDLK